LINHNKRNGYAKWTFFIYFRPIEDTREDASTNPPYVIQAYEIASLKKQTSVTT